MDGAAAFAVPEPWFCHAPSSWAAGIWMTAAIGVAAGMGREASAVLSTILALIILALVLYLTDDGLPNPWDALPPYFSDLLAALE